MRPLVALTVVLLSPLGAIAQTSVMTPAASTPTVTVTAGVGNAMGILGAQAERYLKSGRVSVFGGMGYSPQIDPDDPSGISGAGGVRVFTSGRRHRAFLEVSVSELATETLTSGGVVVLKSRLYGPGVQVGYQYVSPRGITSLASVGMGVPIGAESKTRAALAAGLGLGYTWRRESE
jgi:hypothetical protein